MHKYSVGEKVVYGHTGVCAVEAVTPMEQYSDDKNKLFYVLSPLNGSSCKIYIDVDSKKVILRPMLTENEAQNLLGSVGSMESNWIVNDKERERFFKAEYKSCEPKRILNMLKTIYEHKLKNTKKLNVSDSKILKQAEEYLFSELAAVTGTEPEGIKQTILDRVKNG